MGLAGLRPEGRTGRPAPRSGLPRSVERGSGLGDRGGRKSEPERATPADLQMEKVVDEIVHDLNCRKSKRGEIGSRIVRRADGWTQVQGSGG